MNDNSISDTDDNNTSDDSTNHNNISDESTNHNNISDDSTNHNNISENIINENGTDSNNVSDDSTDDNNTSENIINENSTDSNNVSDDSTDDNNTSENIINENSTSGNIINDNSTVEIDTIHGKKLRITCVERKYRVTDQKSSFIIVAKKEFDEDATEKMLHEDMELKTFLANYEIANMYSLSSGNENIKNQKRKIPEIGKFEIGKKEESEDTKKRRDIITATLKRRELFDSLDLPEEFLVKDYIEAIEKNGIKISNSAMPYDDLKQLEKKGKVKLVKKTDRGVVTYRRIRKIGTDKIGSQSEDDQLDNRHEKTLLPSKHSVDMYID